jgi:hypothetical protein
MAPTPKREAQRRRRNLAPSSDQAPTGEVVVPATPRDWHPLAREMFNSLKVSGQSAFYAQSDWAFAKVICARMSQLLADGSTSGSAWAPVDAGLARLMATEGDRRKMRLELIRAEIAAEQVQRKSTGTRRLKAVDVSA